MVKTKGNLEESCMRKFLVGLLLSLLALPVITQAQQSVVYGIFFYSPACPHCHDVINNDWGAIQDEFGDQLRVLFVNVQEPMGSQLMTQTTQELSINSNGVPMLVIGDEALIGSVDIPAQTARIVREGLANGGIAPPPVTGMAAIFEETLGDEYVPIGTIEAETDDIANALAVGVLIALVASLALVGTSFANPSLRPIVSGRVGKIATVTGLVFSLGLTLTLVLGSTAPWITLLAVVLSLLIGFVLFSLLNANLPETVGIQLLAVVGLLVAVYMAYIETTTAEAVCGAIGACNVVQESPYAAILGIPIGIIGILGYAVLLLLSFIGKRFPQAMWLAFALSAGGVLFSIYLTYLEPFVIKATCVWCLTSAVVMLLLLWMFASEVFSENKQSGLRQTQQA
jgi:uncharacterized membrane protein